MQITRFGALMILRRVHLPRVKQMAEDRLVPMEMTGIQGSLDGLAGTAKRIRDAIAAMRRSEDE